MSSSARLILAVMAAAVALAGCDPSETLRRTGSVKSSPAPSVELGSWVMSPDSFGPITVGTTRAQALATGAYRAAPSPCSRQRLDWHGQRYQESKLDADGDGEADKEMAKPYLASITFGEHGKPEFIDPLKNTVTDRGIRSADSFDRLRTTYGDTLVAGPDQLFDTGSFAVPGKRSYLLFVVQHGKVLGFFIVAGKVKESADVLTVAGVLAKHDKIRVGRGGLC
jgi:hypothetical protein